MLSISRDSAYSYILFLSKKIACEPCKDWVSIPEASPGRSRYDKEGGGQESGRERVEPLSREAEGHTVAVSTGR
jgi:hypothetical protein